MKERQKKVFEIIRQIVDREPSCEIYEHTDLKGDLWMDSLDSFELKMELEKEFQISIPDDMNDKFETVQDILDYLEQALPKT